MTNAPIVFSLFGTESFQNKICDKLHFEVGNLRIHHFPDKEMMIKIDTCVTGKDVIFISSTDRPNEKIMPLIIAAETARELGANKISLITPYLAYMRQDKQFHAGEGITSKYFAKLLSTYFDWVITIDPHLHRWHSLDDVFTVKTTLLHAAQNMADWISQHVNRPLLIGPDMESTQWVADIAKKSHAPFLIVEKTRKGDRDVSATIPQIELYPDHTPILIDDIISTGVTMIETIKHIQSYKIESILCLAVHAIFANQSYEKILETGVRDIITCNTITHPSNKIDLGDLLVDALQFMH